MRSCTTEYRSTLFLCTLRVFQLRVAQFLPPNRYILSNQDKRLLEAVALFGAIGMDEDRKSKRLKRGNWKKIAEYVGRGITNDQCFNRYGSKHNDCTICNTMQNYVVWNIVL